MPKDTRFHTSRSSGYDPHWEGWLLPRITGDFQGRTDEIFQWAACKWGLQDDMLRAVGASESTWYQGLTHPDGRPYDQRGWGDWSDDPSECPPEYRDMRPCPQTFGIMGVKSSSHADTFPHSRDSTAFNVDYYAAWLRGCYEGWVLWLYDVDPGYGPGDIWGCVGTWFAGDWYSPEAQQYIRATQKRMRSAVWLSRSWSRSHY